MPDPVEHLVVPRVVRVRDRRAELRVATGAADVLERAGAAAVEDAVRRLAALESPGLADDPGRAPPESPGS